MFDEIDIHQVTQELSAELFPTDQVSFLILSLLTL